MLKRQPANSPAVMPNVAITQFNSGDVFLFNETAKQIATTNVTRDICSIICAVAGIFAFCIP